MDPRYWDGAYDISDDEKTASATDGPNQGNVAAPATHYWITIDFETRVHLNFEVPATVTITRKEGSAPVYGIVSGNMAAPEPLTLDSNTWNTRVLQVIKPDGTVDISHPNTFTNPAKAPSGGCFIATAAYGSPLAPPVQFLRELRDGVLRKTRWGEKFFDEYWKHYYRISPAIADAMNADPQIMQVMRWSIVEPWTAYMKLLVARPDWDEVDFDALLPAVRDFLLQARGDMERFLSVIEPPKSFKGREAFEAVGELNVLLNFILRTGGKQYLRLMRRTRQLPLKYRKSDRAALVESL